MQNISKNCLADQHPHAQAAACTCLAHCNTTHCVHHLTVSWSTNRGIAYLPLQTKKSKSTMCPYISHPVAGGSAQVTL